MSGGGFDHYKRLLAFSQDTWNEAKAHPHMFYPPRRKERVFSRADKRAARREARAEMMRSL